MDADMRNDRLLKNSEIKLDRRQFLQALGAGITATAFLTEPLRAQMPQSRVVQVGSEQVWQAEELQTEIMQQMLQAAVTTLTGNKDVEEAWQEIVAPEDIVGIKISSEADPMLGTHRQIVDGIVQGLRSAGIPDHQILIWDRMEADLVRLGYTIQMQDTGVRCYATDRSGPGYDPRIFYDTDEDIAARREQGSTRSHFSKIVTQDVTRIINVPVLKQHIASGVSLALKNLAFGSVNNTSRFNGNPVNGDPAIAEICNHAALKQKVALNILDGLVGCFDGGPNYTAEGTWKAGLLLASFDPVAIDYMGSQLIEERRKEAGLSSVLSKARHIRTAARSGLGTNAPDDIDLRDVTV